MQGQRRDAGVDAGEVEQVTDQGAEPLGLVEGSAQRLVVGLHDAVDEVLEKGSLGGERGAQLVRHRRHEAATLLVGRGEVGAIALKARASVPTSSDEDAVTRWP